MSASGLIIARGNFPAAYQQCQAGLPAPPPLWYARRISLMGAGTVPVALNNGTPYNATRMRRRGAICHNQDKTIRIHYREKFNSLILKYQDIINKAPEKNQHYEKRKIEKMIRFIDNRISNVNGTLSFVNQLNIHRDLFIENNCLDKDKLKSEFVPALCTALNFLHIVKKNLPDYGAEFNLASDIMTVVSDQYTAFARAIDKAKAFQQSEAYQSTSEEASTATRETVISLAKAVKEASARYEAMLASPAFKFVLAFREKSENLVNSLRSVKLILDEVGIFFDPGGWTTSLTLDEDGGQRPTGLIVPAAEMPGESTLYHR